MRKVLIKRVVIPAEESHIRDADGNRLPVDLSYKDMFLSALSSSEKGFSYKELSDILPIVNKLKVAGDHVLLEEAEFKLLKSRLEDFRFRFVHEEFTNMILSVFDSEEVKLEAVAEQ